MTTPPEPPAPVITSAEYEGYPAVSHITVTGTSEVPGTVTLYDGEAAVSETTTVVTDDGFTFSFTLTDPARLAAGTHSYAVCVTTKPDPSDHGGATITSPMSEDVGTVVATSPVPPPAPDHHDSVRAPRAGEGDG